MKLKSLSLLPVSLRSAAFSFDADANAADTLGIEACALGAPLVGVVVPEPGALELDAASVFETAVLASFAGVFATGFDPPMFNDTVTGGGASAGALSSLSCVGGGKAFEEGGRF